VVGPNWVGKIASTYNTFSLGDNRDIKLLQALITGTSCS